MRLPVCWLLSVQTEMSASVSLQQQQLQLGTQLVRDLAASLRSWHDSCAPESDS